VVPTRDRPAHLDACLTALAAAVRPDDHLVVVDSASRGRDVAAIAAAHDADVLRCEQPGASRARNAGIRAAEHDLIAFIDDDVRVRAGWAQAIARPFADPAVAFVTGRVTAPEHQQDAQRPLALKEDLEGVTLDRFSPAPLGASANLAVRRDALVHVSGFDERLGGGARFGAAEDLDLFDRLLGAGYVGWYEPAAWAEHEQWRDRTAVLRLDLRYGIGLGARLAKLMRSDHARARMALREVGWSDGLVPLGRGLRTRHEFEIATAALRIVGTVLGVFWGLGTPVRGGQFR
jgi:glycosyltransferase involved in cell wall biosynthesis